MTRIDDSKPFLPVNIAVLTVSDTRTHDDDKSGRTLVDLVFAHAPPPGERPARRPRSFSEVPSTTPSSKALAAELRGSGFRFVGPVVAYALMQSAGVVDDHLEGCWVAP